MEHVISWKLDTSWKLESLALGAGRAGPSASWKLGSELEVKYLTSWNLYLYILLFDKLESQVLDKLEK